MSIILTEALARLINMKLREGGGENLSDPAVMQENEPNQYCQEYSIGDKVKFKHAGGRVSPQTAKIIGYDDTGYYELEWPDGEVSIGIHDMNLVQVKPLKEEEEPNLPDSYYEIDDPDERSKMFQKIVGRKPSYYELFGEEDPFDKNGGH